MSFSSQDTQAQPQAQTPAKPKNFGDALGQYAKARLPIAGGLLGSLMGGYKDDPSQQPTIDPTGQVSQEDLQRQGLAQQPQLKGASSILLKLLGIGG